MRTLILLSCVIAAPLLPALPIDVSGVKSGPVRVTPGNNTVSVQWPDAGGKQWQAEFSLIPAQPLITSIGPVGGTAVMQGANPMYDCEIGKRRGGWDEFFDNPSLHPDGTKRFGSVFRMTSAKATSIGDRVELFFDGLQMGPFHGGVAITIYPGSRMIQQEAVVSTQENDTAFYYNAGIRMRAPQDAGEVMNVPVSFYDTMGNFQTIRSRGPERAPLQVRHRAISVKTAGGTVVAFPAPHQYFMPRDFTSNMGFTWHFAWRGQAAIGIRQYPDDNTRFYPWMNAPPGTLQRLSLFYVVDDGEPKAAVDSVVRYTHGDRFQRLDGYRTVASHWHLNYTVQSMQNGLDWVPPFKPVLKQMGVDAVVIMDFHGDGHPGSLEEIRLKELEAYQKACKAQSDSDFLIIPGEEANVWLGGHYCLMFPKQVYWFMKRPEGTPVKTTDPKYGIVYHIGNATELLELMRAEGGLVYQAHPRTKASMGFPDKIRETEHFRDPHFFGTGWKALPADLSSPRLGERAFKTIDDINNWGFHKLYVGEADVFQFNHTDELYAHMNVNYVRLPKLPDYDHYADALKALTTGDSFISTGEVLLPEVKLSTSSPNSIAVRANVSWTFPLRTAEIVWGDGTATHRKMIPLDTTREFGKQSFDWNVADAKDWKWARLAVWDVAGNGAFTQPILHKQN
jgi:hypothetical protein